MIGAEDTLVYIDEIEYKEYKSWLGGRVEIRTHPSLYGCGAIWKYMTEANMNEDYLVILGDDTIGFDYMAEPEVPLRKETARFRKAVQNTYYMADDLKTPFFGWGAGPLRTNNLELISFKGVLYVPFGIIPKHLGSIMFDPRFVIAVDTDAALQCKYFKRFYVIDNRYRLKDETWTNVGGCSTLRNHETYNRRNELLIQKYGSNVIQTKGRKKNQITIHMEF